MTKTIRLATFNCQNLASRARLLTLSERDHEADVLGQLGELESLLAKARYASADKRRIEALSDSLWRHLEVVALGGMLFAGRGAARRVVAAGASAWQGEIRFRRAPITSRQRHHKAQVIGTVAADVQCLMEVEDRQALDAFNRHGLQHAYPEHMLIDDLDPRRLNIGVLSKLPMATLRSRRLDHDAGPGGPASLEVELALSGTRSLHLLIAHLERPRSGDPRAHDTRRRRRAAALAELVARRFDTSQDLLAVLGDLGDSPQRASQSLAPLLKLPGLSDVLALQFPISDDRWTFHDRMNEQTDYILVSDALKAAFRQAGIERRGMPALPRHSIDQEQPFPGVASRATAASLHAAVWADFMV
jgi:endonuclease/exonuclease/phosphatase family metal-dependent hydrolase